MIDFSEDCTFTGNVHVKFDWANLLEGDKKPALMETGFFSESAVQNYSLNRDTLLTDMIATGYKVLAYNHDQSLTYTGLQNIETTQVELPVNREDDKLYTVQVPTLYAAKAAIQVSADNLTLCELVPKSYVRQVFVNFVVSSNGFPEVKSVAGELSGVATTYSLDLMEAMPSSAILPFDSNKLSKDRFLSTLRVFGVNPAQEGQTEIQKSMNLSLELADGKTYYENIDLTRLFSGFTGASMYLTLEIRLTAMGINIAITDWHSVDWGEIEL